MARRERETRAQIALRDKRAVRTGSLGSLTRYCPELRQARADAIARELQGYMSELEFRVRRIVREELRALGMRGAA